MKRTTFVVRAEHNDAKSETIAKADTYNAAVEQASTFLMEKGRDYECFYVVEVDRRGQRVIGGNDWGTVSWEPRG